MSAMTPGRKFWIKTTPITKRRYTCPPPPPSPAAGGQRAGRRAQPPAVGLGKGAAPRDEFREASQLGAAQRGSQIGQLVVEAGGQGFSLRAPPEVADPGEEQGVASRHHPAFARGE